MAYVHVHAYILQNAHDKQVKYMLCIHVVAIFFKEKQLFDVLFKSKLAIVYGWWQASPI